MPNPQWEKTTETPEDWESWTPVDIVHFKTGWQIEIRGEPKGIVFPDLTAAHLWLQLLLQTPDLASQQLRVSYDDRREMKD